jgi:hypothetical protein
LLIAIAVIAILSVLLFPAIRSAYCSARQAKAVNYMKQIALAYMGYMYSGSDRLGISVGDGATAHDWLKVLAEGHYLNDPRLVMFDFDYLVKTDEVQANVMNIMGWIFGAISRRLYDINKRELDQDFIGKPLSIVVVAGQVSMDKELSIPICWTRGLNDQGYWNESQGPQGGVFGTSGGIIAFIDGSARWFDDLHGSDSPLHKWDMDEKTSHIFECLRPGSRVLDWQGILHIVGSEPSSPAGGQGVADIEDDSPESEDEDNDVNPPVQNSPPPSEGEISEPAPNYESFSVEVDFAEDTAALQDAAAACGVKDVYGNILDTYEELRKKSGASNEAVDAYLEEAFGAFAGILGELGMVLDTSEEMKAMYWSGFLGDDGMYYTDNQSAWDYIPSEAAREVLGTLQGIDVAIGSAYDDLGEEQKLQFAAVVNAFSSGEAGGDVNFSSNGAKWAQAYLMNQAWISAMRRTIQ